MGSWGPRKGREAWPPCGCLSDVLSPNGASYGCRLWCRARAASPPGEGVQASERWWMRAHAAPTQTLPDPSLPVRGAWCQCPHRTHSFLFPSPTWPGPGVFKTRLPQTRGKDALSVMAGVYRHRLALPLTLLPGLLEQEATSRGSYQDRTGPPRGQMRSACPPALPQWGVQLPLPVRTARFLCLTAGSWASRMELFRLHCALSPLPCALAS